jgi:hypothetical protein
MESNIEEALKAKEYAEKLFSVKDFAGARHHALKSQSLCPGLEGVSQMVATYEIYCASLAKINGELDYYAVLGSEPYSGKVMLKKQYRKLAVMLHPDKNKTSGADGAFKLLSEAWTLLSDSVKRRSYDLRRKRYLSKSAHKNLPPVHTAGVTSFEHCSNSISPQSRQDSFWTVCTSCHVQYEYLRKYVNKRLSCKNCRGVFIAVETGAAPVTGSFSYGSCPYIPENGYAGHGYNGGVTYVQNAAVCFTGNGPSGYHPGHGSGHGSSNMSFQWNGYPGAVDPNGVSHKSVTNGSLSREKSNGKHHMKTATANASSNGYTELPAPKIGRPAKARKVDTGAASGNINEETALKIGSDLNTSNGNVSILNDNFAKRFSSAPAFDARKLLIDKARTVIRGKLEEMKLVFEKEEKRKKMLADAELELRKTASMPIIVPDSDFHDFDKDRTEECFKPKQIWALYDEEDGMPRLYCMIREIISVKPFKIHISYLNSKTDTEFGAVNWVDSGFTKSCGNFRVFYSEVIDQVNIFSHLLSREKAGRGGCVRIYPKSGDIWAVYRNWSPDWDCTTPDEVRHQYEMVEVLDDYSEDLGVCVAPLIKLDGYKTVYQRNLNKDSIRWVPRREMLRFSHQVPSCLLTADARNLPEGCWDLDPAATPDELLQPDKPALTANVDSVLVQESMGDQ